MNKETTVTEQEWIGAAKGLLERLLNGSQSPAPEGLRYDSLRDIARGYGSGSPSSVSLNRHIAHIEALLRRAPK